MSLTVDVQGAAEILKVHPWTVRQMIAAGELPAAQVGRAFVILTKDVMSYVENQIARQTAARMRRPLKVVSG